MHPGGTQAHPEGMGEGGGGQLCHMGGVGGLRALQALQLQRGVYACWSHPCGPMRCGQPRSSLTHQPLVCLSARDVVVFAGREACMPWSTNSEEYVGSTERVWPLPLPDPLPPPAPIACPTGLPPLCPPPPPALPCSVSCPPDLPPPCPPPWPCPAA